MRFFFFCRSLLSCPPREDIY